MRVLLTLAFLGLLIFSDRLFAEEDAHIINYCQDFALQDCKEHQALEHGICYQMTRDFCYESHGVKLTEDGQIQPEPSVVSTPPANDKTVVAEPSSNEPSTGTPQEKVQPKAKSVVENTKATPPEATAKAPQGEEELAQRLNPKESMTPNPNNLQAITAMEGRVDTLEEEIENCSETKKEAVKCCSDSNQCFSGAAGMSVMLQMATQYKSAQGGMAAQCDALKLMTRGAQGMQGLALGICTMKKSECESTCGDSLTEVEDLKKELAHYCQPVGEQNAPVKCETTKIKLERIEKKYSMATNTCEALDEQQITQGMQIAAFEAAHRLAGECEEATTNQSTDFPEYATTGQMFSGDCSNPAFYNHPTCMLCRGTPQNSACVGVIGLNGSSSSSEDTDTTQANNTDTQSFNTSSLVGDRNEEDLDLGDPQMVQGTSADITRAANSAGGRGPSSSSSALQALGISKKPGRSKGKNTDILKGTRGGGGYVSKMGYKNGGGYSPSAQKSQAHKKQNFSLKDYLPGGKKYQKRELANAHLSSSGATLPADSNIFERLSHRFHQQCKKGLFENCGTTYWESRRKNWKNGEPW